MMPVENVSNTPLLTSAEALKTLHATSRRTLSALPILVHYNAPLIHATQVMRNGEITFVTSRIRDHMFLEAEPRDAFQVRDEFLKITTPRDAVNFLCQSGDFLRYRDFFTWAEFQRWQRLAEVVTFERDTLTRISEIVRSGKKAAKLDPTGELTEALSFISGKYSNFIGKHPRPAEKETEHDAHWNTEQSRLGTCFSEPDTYTISIMHISDPSLPIEPQLFGTEDLTLLPSNPDLRWEALQPSLQREAYQNTVLYPNEARIPVLVIRPHCALEAIAAANYADRIAGVTIIKCAGCNKIFEKETRAKKTYCDPMCKDRHKKWKKRHPEG